MGSCYTCNLLYLHILHSSHFLGMHYAQKSQRSSEMLYKVQKTTMCSLHPLNVVFRWNQGEMNRVASSGVETNDKGRTGCEAQSPSIPLVTGSRGYTGGKAEILLHQSARLSPALSPATAPAKRGEENGRIWIGDSDSSYCGNLLLNSVGAKYRVNISRIKNKYFGPSLGNISS